MKSGEQPRSLETRFDVLCFRCGSHVKDDAESCWHCGADLTQRNKGATPERIRPASRIFAIAYEPGDLIALKAPDLQGSLEDLPLIESVGTSDGWSKWREVIGPVLQPEIFVDSYGAALHMAAQGNGVALV
ncbi:MAG: hypothetical protein AAF449_24955, partial [Myxococcota bacterium]